MEMGTPLAIDSSWMRRLFLQLNYFQSLFNDSMSKTVLPQGYLQKDRKHPLQWIPRTIEHVCNLYKIFGVSRAGKERTH